MNPKTKKALIAVFVGLVLIGLACAAITLVGAMRVKDEVDNKSTEVLDAQREYDVETIELILSAYVLDHGSFDALGDIPMCEEGDIEIGKGEGKLDLTSLDSNYFSNIPKDKTMGSDEATGYSICKVSDYKIAAKSLHAGKQ